MLGVVIGITAAAILALPAASLPVGRQEARFESCAPADTRTPQQIRRYLARRLKSSELSDLQIPFEADDDICELAAEVTAHAHDDRQRLAALRRYFKRRGFLEQYDRYGTRTARQVLQSGEGNCLSYANLFVAMARAAGLRAYYLDASEQLNEFGKSGSVLVRWGHVLVGVRIGPDWIAVEFDGRAGRARRYRVVSDLEAIADFYNNLGSELAWSGGASGGFGSGQAIRAYSMATRIDPGFARAWNNLGVALSRAGRQREAMSAYKSAIHVSPGFPAPRANLGHFLRKGGNPVAARRAYAKAVALAPGNAHYRYFLGRELLDAGQEDQAREQFMKGRQLDDSLFQIQLELARLHVKRAELRQAREAARRVLELVPGQRDARRLLDRLGHSK
ncbi:MAG TPA: tetratricopeptide repeat protein [Myxococcota bacterium]|nr:tetratricopeptide repeat protein [Myxococcota bacterium]